MTDKEKAKAYDEALALAKRLISNNCTEVEKLCLKCVFPELKESEDERIRKALCKFISDTLGDELDGYDISKNEALTYLEKQKESQELPLMNGDADLYFDTWRQEVPVPTFRQCFEEGMRYAQRLQKEQKPKQVPKWLYRLEFKDNSCGLWYNGQGEWCFENGIGSLDDSCKTKNLPMDYDERYKQDGRNWFSSCSKKEDLLHWYSKEDAKTLLNKGFVFTRYLATEYHEYDQQTVFIKETALYREEINFLELMKEQKPAEWSEEDEQRIAEIEFAVMQMNTKRVNTKDKCLAWLKSLRPQSHWKPSEEQMEALKNVAFGNYQNGDGPVLRGLYGQLKRLM